MNAYRAQQREQDLREELVHVGRLLWEKGLIAATDGNISARLDDERILTTPSGLSKGFMKPEQMVITDMTGRKLNIHDPGSRGLEPSSELLMHLEVYRQRPDVGAVVHAHPPITTAFTIAGISLAQCVLPEVVMTLGSILTTQYATPSSAQGAEVVRELIRTHDALVLDRHGAITVGKTPTEAYTKMEKVEHTALVTLTARQLGRVGLLPPEEVRKLTAWRRQKLGLPAEYGGEGCVKCGACGRESEQEESTSMVDEEITRLVARW